jgi:hypothetical protein
LLNIRSIVVLFFDKFIMASAAFKTLPVKFLNIYGDREKDENQVPGLYYEYLPDPYNPKVITKGGDYFFLGSDRTSIKIEKNVSGNYMLNRSDLTLTPENARNAKELLKMIIDNTNFNDPTFNDIAEQYLTIINKFIPQPLSAVSPQSAGSRNRRSRKNRSKKSKKSKSRKH